MSKAKLAWALPWRENEGNAKIEDGMTAESYPFGFASISRRDIFFQYKMMVDDRERYKCHSLIIEI